MKRSLRKASALLFVLLLGVALLPLPGATAEADSTSLLEGLGLPVLEFTITDDGIVVPESAEAGALLVRVANESEGTATFAIAQLPEGVTVDDLGEELIAENTAAWVADAVVPGALEIEPGDTGEAVYLLDGGDWAVAVALFSGEGEEGAGRPLPGATLAVTGELSADAADALPSDVVISYGPYAFDFSGPLPAGPQIVKLTNTHEVLHHAVIFRTDRLYTQEEAHAGVMTLFSGTPEAEGFAIEFPPLVVTPALSGGQSLWIELDLEPGFYLAICFIADPGQDVPHVVFGMVGSFEVAE